MRKLVTKTVAVLLLALLVGCDVADATSSLVSSEDISIAETSSEEVSSEETSSDATLNVETSSKENSNKERKELKDFIMEDGFLDVTAASLEIKAKGGDDSFYFAPMEGVKGYQVNGGIYNLDAETLRRLVNVPVRGDARIRWIGYEDCGSWSGNLEQPEFAPANKINDPIFMSMFLPSERRCFLESRVNPSFLDVAEDKWVNVMTIGAVYRNLDVEIPDDAEFTLCISDVNLAVRTTKSDGWYEAINIKVPTVYNHLYYLPWQLERQLGTYELHNRITFFDDHVEIKLKGADLNASEAKKVSSEVQQCVYHFWGQMHYFDCKGSEVLGVASSFKIWVKEPEAKDYLTVGIGADWRDANGGILQAFAGSKHAVTNEPKVVIGHNVEPCRYDEVMDSEKVQEILGIR